MTQNLAHIARSWIGTPYRFGQCVRGAGADCATFLMGVFKEAGEMPAGMKLSRRYNRQFTRNADWSAFVHELRACGLFDCVWDREESGALPEMRTGDLFVLVNSKKDGHLGMLLREGGRDTFIHCCVKGGVEEIPISRHNLSSVWRRKP